jgi:hypothetical protein
MKREEGEWVRIGRGQKQKINVGQAAMASMINFEENFRAKT